MVSLFQRLTRANRSHRSLKKIKELRLKEVIQSFGIKRGEKLLKTYKKYNFFLSNRLFLCSKDRFDCVKDLILSIQSWSISFKRLPRAIWSWLIFLKDWWEQFDHRRSFSKIEGAWTPPGTWGSQCPLPGSLHVSKHASDCSLTSERILLSSIEKWELGVVFTSLITSDLIQDHSHAVPCIPP